MLHKDPAYCLNPQLVLFCSLWCVEVLFSSSEWTSVCLSLHQTCSSVSLSASTSSYLLPSVQPSGGAVVYQRVDCIALYGASYFIIFFIFIFFQRDGCSFRTSLPSPAEGTWRARLIWLWTPPTTAVFTSHPCILTITTCTTTPSTKWQWPLSLPQVRQGVRL